MKTMLFILFLYSLIYHTTPGIPAGENNRTTHTPVQRNLSVLVLPPYDVIAGEGISPDIQEYIEKVIPNDVGLKLIKFPYRQLMNVPYQNVFDKKFCKPVMDKVQADIIIMSKIDQSQGTGDITTDKWDIQIKIYNTKTGNQQLSSLAFKKLTSKEIESFIRLKQADLFADIKNKY